MTWEEVTKVLQGYQSHLELQRNDAIATLQTRVDLAGYLEGFDLSRGDQQLVSYCNYLYNRFCIAYLSVLKANATVPEMVTLKCCTL